MLIHLKEYTDLCEKVDEINLALFSVILFNTLHRVQTQDGRIIGLCYFISEYLI